MQSSGSRTTPMPFLSEPPEKHSRRDQFFRARCQSRQGVAGSLFISPPQPWLHASQCSEESCRLHPGKQLDQYTKSGNSRFFALEQSPVSLPQNSVRGGVCCVRTCLDSEFTEILCPQHVDSERNAAKIGMQRIGETLHYDLLSLNVCITHCGEEA
jgi:hypothetical protein